MKPSFADTVEIEYSADLGIREEDMERLTAGKNSYVFITFYGGKRRADRMRLKSKKLNRRVLNIIGKAFLTGIREQFKIFIQLHDFILMTDVSDKTTFEGITARNGFPDYDSVFDHNVVEIIIRHLTRNLTDDGSCRTNAVQSHWVYGADGVAHSLDISCYRPRRQDAGKDEGNDDKGKRRQVTDEPVQGTSDSVQGTNEPGEDISETEQDIIPSGAVLRVSFPGPRKVLNWINLWRIVGRLVRKKEM